MERPGWVLMVGVMMLMIGGCGGCLQDIKQIKTKKLMSLADRFIDAIPDEFEEEEIDTDEIEVLKVLAPDVEFSESDTIITADKLKSVISSVTSMSEKTQQTLTMHGYIGIVISTIYGLIGFLLPRKRDLKIVKLAYGIIGLSMLFTIYQIIAVSSMEMSQMFKFGENFNLTMGGLFDLLMLLIILISSKRYFTENHGEILDHYDNQNYSN